MKVGGPNIKHSSLSLLSSLQRAVKFVPKMFTYAGLFVDLYKLHSFNSNQIRSL